MFIPVGSWTITVLQWQSPKGNTKMELTYHRFKQGSSPTQQHIGAVGIFHHSNIGHCNLNMMGRLIIHCMNLLTYINKISVIIVSCFSCNFDEDDGSNEAIDSDEMLRDILSSSFAARYVFPVFLKKLALIAVWHKITIRIYTILLHLWTLCCQSCPSGDFCMPVSVIKLVSVYFLLSNYSLDIRFCESGHA